MAVGESCTFHFFFICFDVYIGIGSGDGWRERERERERVFGFYCTCMQYVFTICKYIIWNQIAYVVYLLIFSKGLRESPSESNVN